MKRLVLIFGIASGALGAITAVIHAMLSHWVYEPFGYSFEVIWDAAFLGLGRAGGLDESTSSWIWGALEFGLNTLLCFAAGALVGFLVHLWRAKYRQWEHEPDICMSYKLALWAAAWVATALAMTVIKPSSWSYFWAFAYYSPITLLLTYVAGSFLGKLPFNLIIAVGWLYYCALTVAVLRLRRRWQFYIVYSLLLISLALNVEGCREWFNMSFSQVTSPDSEMVRKAQSDSTIRRFNVSSLTQNHVSPCRKIFVHSS